MPRPVFFDYFLLLQKKSDSPSRAKTSAQPLRGNGFGRHDGAVEILHRAHFGYLPVLNKTYIFIHVLNFNVRDVAFFSVLY